MMKNILLKVVVGIVFLALFNTLFFVLGGTDHLASVWISYAFLHVSYLCLLLTPLFKIKHDGLTTLSATLYLINTSYFILELIAGLTFIFWIQEEIFWPLLIQSVMFVIYLLIFCFNVLGNDATQASIKKQQQQSDYIRRLSLKLRTVINSTDNQDIKKMVRRCYEGMCASPLNSTPDVADLDLEIENAVKELADAAASGNPEKVVPIEKRLCSLISERKETLKLTCNY